MTKQLLSCLFLVFFYLSTFANGTNPTVTLCSGKEMSWNDYQMFKKLRADDYDIEIDYMSNESFKPFEASMVNSTNGAWSSVIEMPLVASAAAHLPDGRIMTWAARDKLAFGGNLGRTWTGIFDPANNSTTEFLIDQTNHDMFCPGTSTLPDGRIIVSGGSSSGRSSIYDPFTEQWNTGDDMNISRGYHSSVTLASGATFIIGGSWSGGAGGKDSEVWSEKTGWYSLPGVPVDVITDGINSTQNPNHDDYFPWLWVAPNGQLFHAGPSPSMHWIDPEGNGSYSSAGQRGNDDYSVSGTTVMYDVGKILKTGGTNTFEDSSPANGNSYIIDINNTSPQVTQVGNLNQSRVYHNSVVLPNGEVLVIGGIPISNVFSDVNSRLIPEIWNPNTGQWTQLASMSVPRNYHSTALLMADGRVFSAGGGLCNTCSTNHPDAQIFSPPYLFNTNGSLATRPVITSAPNSADFSSNIVVNTNASIASFSMVRMASVTHSTNNEQRRIPITATNLGGNQYQLNIPNKNILPPGRYMLFAMNSSGTPSVARFIKVGDDINDCTPLSNPNLGGSGLEATYYNNTNFTDPVSTQIDPTIDFDWGLGSPAGNIGNETFSVRWEGKIEVPRSGTYTFYTNSDDGVRLWVNGKLTVQNWTVHVPTENIGMIHLDPNQQYDIRLDYYEEAGGAVMELRWSGPGIDKQIVPAQNLFPNVSCTPGGNCNDGDACTINDVFDNNCNCSGTFQDNDNDGICNANDQCPNLNNDLIGTSCDDGNPNTNNDVYQSNCSCAGTPTGGGDCDDVSITTNSNSITVSGLNSPITQVQIFDPTWSTVLNCSGNCSTTEVASGLSSGNHFVKVRLYTANWQFICEIEEYIDVGGGGCTDNDNDGVCADADCDDNNPNLPTNPGTACNDGNSNTNNDIIQSDGCTCAGTPTGGGGDCDDISITTNSNSITVSGLNSPITQVQIFDPTWSTVLNCSGNCSTTEVASGLSSGNHFVKVRLYTANWQFICEIEEYIDVGGGGCTDNDNDGVCADADCDDNNPNLPTNPGTACNDGNSNTNNDIIQSDGCTCAGTPTGGGGDCDDVSITTNSNSITVSGLNSPITQVQIFDPTWSTVLNCSGNCSTTEVASGLSSGNHFVKVRLYTANWQFICEIEEYIDVGGGGCTDNDNDGVCANDDCDDNNPNLPTNPGTACNDGNSNTNNDVIQSDGCTCAGTPTGGGNECDNVNVSFSGSNLNVSGLNTTPVSILQVFNSQWQTIFNCAGNCNSTETLSNLPNDTYFVKVTLYTAGWSQICLTESYITGGGSNLVSQQESEHFFFTAQKSGREVSLNWVTNTAYKNESFLIERSTDGINFELINEIESRHDLWNMHYTYSEKDPSPQLGKNFYRIKKMHHDGSFDYSMIREIEFNLDLDVFTVYPNPTAGDVYISLQNYVGSKAVISIYNNLGELMDVQNVVAIGEGPIRFSVDRYPSGLYLVAVKVEDRKLMTEKLVVNKL